MRAVTVIRRDDGSVTVTSTGLDQPGCSAIVELLHEGIALASTRIPTSTTNHNEQEQGR